MKKNKKYSLEERVNYYNSIKEKEFKKYDKTSKITCKFNYANGFVQGAKNGYSLNYNDLGKFEKLGQKAGVKARRKSEKIKF